jgi:hypothetical protein
MDREFAAGDRPAWRCYFRVVRGIPADALPQATVVAVELMDAGTVRRFDVAFPRAGVVYRDLRERIAHQGALRACLSAQVTPLGPDAPIGNGALVRIEVVPEAQRALAPGQRLLAATRAEFGAGHYLQPCGWPLFLAIAPGTTLAQAAPAILEGLAVAEEDAKKAKFLSGTQWVLYAREALLRPDTDLSLLPDTAAVFVLVDGRRPARSRAPEAVLKIKN